MAKAQKDEKRMVRVYELVNPEVILKWEAEIKQLLGQVLSLNPKSPDFLFHISHTSGWMYFEAKDLIRATKPKFTLPPNATEAKKFADAFLVKFAKVFLETTKYPFLKNLKGIEMIPRFAKAIDAVAVGSSDGPHADHWLVRYDISLPGFDLGNEKLVVKGSQLEVRIGDRGQVVGFNTRWTPIRQKFFVVPFVPFEETGHPHEESEDTSESPVAQTYCLFGDDIPQFYLAPYHFQKQGHHANLHTACKYALEVSFVENHTPEEMEITATVEGGSGDYSFGWGYYTLESFWDKGVVEPGVDGPTIKISPPIYAMVMCHVLDRKTKAYFYHKQQVIGTPQMEKETTNSQTA
jgi:hypothetical protein